MSNSAFNIQIHGQVQGVGFRPFVHNLARRLGVEGGVSNGADGVKVIAQAPEEVLEQFVHLLQSEAPAMAEIDTISIDAVDVIHECDGFKILTTVGGEVDQTVTPDAAVCMDCLTELFDPENRRYRYPFINCTNCGPRYSLITALPYDRINTTMSAFSLCPPCREEYLNPDDRRFHAQPTACESCGPQLALHNAAGEFTTSEDPLADALELILQGGILAMKGVGGFHLVCDARNADAVERLRFRKHRDEKPFALMAANPQSLSPFVELNESRRQRLTAMDAPICLCPKKELGSDPLPEGIAPGLAWLGVMLPHAPVHYLLFHKASGEPTGTQWLSEAQSLLLVMTSANLSGNPLIIDNETALNDLQGIADGFLVHDRRIHTRCDDSVVNAVPSKPFLIRRGRGLAPQRIRLPAVLRSTSRSVLAVGAFFKNTLCLTKGEYAYVSQYIGDLDNPDCCRQLKQTAEALKSLLNIEPDLVVSDNHPDFYSSQFAAQYSESFSIPLLRVQHHHAHIAAVMAEHQLSEPVIGLALDGLGLGEEGALWGGELLRVEGEGYRRLSHLSPLMLPGGDQAAKEPWRIAAGALSQLGQSEQIDTRFADHAGHKVIRQLLERNINCPQTSSAGRLFDAAAALLGIKEVSNYEAQAAMMLESSAYRYLLKHAWPQEERLIFQQGEALNTLPLLSRLTRCEDAEYGAALFHRQLIDALGDWVTEASHQQGLTSVVLAGGCFLNQLLLTELSSLLCARGVKVFCAEKMPSNDGAIALGQAQIALMQLAGVQHKENNKRESVCA